MMKTAQEEQYEYEKFMVELAHKVREIQQDINHLSDDNKDRVKNGIMRAFMLNGIVGVSEYFNQWK